MNISPDPESLRLTSRDLVEPAPPVMPNPNPSPTRDDDADRALAATLRPWCYRQHLGLNEKAARAAADWLRARGV